MLRDAAISLSLANLCFVKVWGRLLSNFGAYFNEFPIAYAATVIDVLLLAALFFTAIRILRHRSKASLMKVARWTFLFTLLTALNGVAALAVTLSGINFSALMGRNLAYFTALGVTASAVLVAVKMRDRVIRVALGIILALLPFVLFTFSQALWKLTRNVGVVHAESKPSAPALIARKTPATRVLWIVFDEMDQRMTFTERPPGLKLPELDRFRSQSVYAVNAYPPAPITYMSMPALITGRLVSKVTPVSANELMINFDGQQSAVGWSAQPNVFSEASHLGFNAGLVGWCNPYCEVIGDSLRKCDEVKDKYTGDVSLKTSMFLQAEGLIGTIPLVPQAAVPLLQRVDLLNRLVTAGERQKYIVRFEHVRNGAVKSATDPDLDLILIHSPAPHPPGIYDTAKNDFSRDGKSSYVDNLKLVDRTLSDLRRAMENSGMWDKTTVIISSDHWWRTEMWSRGPFWTHADAVASGGKMDHRIPFMVRLAGQNAGITYTPAFNTVVTHDLILALLRGEVSNPDSLTGWLDHHRSISDSPYNRDDLLP